jgi:flagellar hook-basal body complex protein FliE
MGNLRIDKVARAPLGKSEKVKQKGETGFAEAIKGAITRASTLEKQADKSIVNLLRGEADITQTMIALQKADLSMRLVLAVRNKVIEAYREVMHAILIRRG